MKVCGRNGARTNNPLIQSDSLPTALGDPEHLNVCPSYVYMQLNTADQHINAIT